MKSFTMSRVMFSRMIRLIAVAIFLLLCLIPVIRRRTSNVDFRNVLHLRPSKLSTELVPKKLTNLQPLFPVQFKNQSDFECIKLTIGNLTYPMCIYDPQSDNAISKFALSGNYYEVDLVKKVLNLFRVHPELSFVDIGANLGTYSLPIAHSGIHVVAVEPNGDTVRRLAKSVFLGGIEENVDIFHYALSNEESTTLLKFDAVNRGDTFMVEKGSCADCISAKVTVLNNLIPFIRHKRVFMKVDAQEAEIKIFQRKSAAKFFDEIDVVMIQMEWLLYPKRFGATEEGRKRVDRFLEFFYQRGYDVYDPRSELKLDADWRKWTFDVLFKKDELPKDHLFDI